MDLDAWYVASSKEFLQMSAAVTKCLPPGVSRPYISTMTFTASISTTAVVASRQVLERLQAAQDPFFSRIVNSAFCPNVIELCSDISRVKVKMFNKGSLQLTGCTSAMDCLLPLTEICRLFSEVFDDDVYVSSIDLRLINFNAAVIPSGSGKIHLERVSMVARTEPFNLLSERPERPASCIIHTSTGKAMVYATGKCSVHANSPSNVAQTFQTLVSIVCAAHQDCEDHRSVAPPVRGKQSGADIIGFAMPGLMHSHLPTDECVVSCVYCRLYGNVFAPSSGSKLDVSEPNVRICGAIPVAGPAPEK